MSNTDWLYAFARQADADLRAFEFFQENPKLLIAECHALLFLQMACEKLCKAHRLGSGEAPDLLFATHAAVAHSLPTILRTEMSSS
jgi:hypothetical protein